MSQSEIMFRHALLQDKQPIIDFLNQNWGSRHPLVNREEFFKYYYQNGETIQFVLALEQTQIVAVAGYILANKNPIRDAWVSIWCASGSKNGVGLELMECLPRLANICVLACNNIRPKTMAFYRFLGWHADRISHFYRLSDSKNFQLVKNAALSCPAPQGNLTLQPVTTPDQLAQLGIPKTDCVPQKDIWYLTRRYFHFPHQSYDVWAVMQKNVLVGYLMTRTVFVVECNTSVLRIVDFIGQPEWFGQLGNAIEQLMKNIQAEYADCYCVGISADIFAQAGFLERIENDSVIVPNYLTPPLWENTEYYYFTNQSEQFVLFKADGDQDRPNLN